MGSMASAMSSLTTYSTLSDLSSLRETTDRARSAASAALSLDMSMPMRPRSVPGSAGPVPWARFILTSLAVLSTDTCERVNHEVGEQPTMNEADHAERPRARSRLCQSLRAKLARSLLHSVGKHLVYLLYPFHPRCRQ
jgi:hypothetical protein